MKREISSKQTFFLKIILPIFFALNFVAAFFAIYSQFGGDAKSAFSMFPVFIVIIGLILLLVKRYKFVSIDDNFLYVSNYSKEISIPFSNIRDVTESRLRCHAVTIHLKTASELGEKITFLPKVKAFTSYKSHPIVGELKKLANLEQ